MKLKLGQLRTLVREEIERLREDACGGTDAVATYPQNEGEETLEEDDGGGGDSGGSTSGDSGYAGWGGIGMYGGGGGGGGHTTFRDSGYTFDSLDNRDLLDILFP